MGNEITNWGTNWYRSQTNWLSPILWPLPIKVANVLVCPVMCGPKFGWFVQSTPPRPVPPPVPFVPPVPPPNQPDPPPPPPDDDL